MIHRPYQAPGIGWIFAVIALVVGLLITADVLSVSPQVVGIVAILLSAAVLLG